jgi:hypothetical protein
MTSLASSSLTGGEGSRRIVSLRRYLDEAITHRTGVVNLYNGRYLGRSGQGQGFSLVCEALRDSRGTIESLYLGRNQLTPEMFSELCSTLVHPLCCVKILNLAYCNLSEEQIELLANQVLKRPGNRIEVLDLAGTKFTPKIIECIGQVLENAHCGLINLSLLGTIDGPEQFLPIGRLTQALKRSPTVTKRCVKRNIQLPVVVSRSDERELAQQELQHVSGVIETSSNWLGYIVTLLACRLFPRLSQEAPVRILPVELIRKVAQTLPLRSKIVLEQEEVH